MKKQDLKTTEYSDYIGRYISKLADSTALKIGYEQDEKMIIDFFISFPKDKLEYRYEIGKWTPKEIFQHIIDTERIFIYRILCIARNDKTNLPDYDQNNYIIPSGANTKTLKELITEFNITRAYSLNLLQSLSDKSLKNMGIVSNTPISARACAFLILGHSIWHIDVLKQRYL